MKWIIDVLIDFVFLYRKKLHFAARERCAKMQCASGLSLKKVCLKTGFTRNHI